jgi:hypothetical protein
VSGLNNSRFWQYSQTKSCSFWSGVSSHI